MFFSHLTEGGALPALVLTLSFSEQRQRMIAENVANWGNPNYKTLHLDAGEFQRTLGEALKRRGGDKTKPLTIPHSRQFETDPRGRLKVHPAEAPPDSLLFHDGTNMSIEQQMSDLAENAIVHESAASILRRYFEAYRKAIRGTP